MYLEIVSPEATLFSGDVTSVTVPGVNGEFQMLENHAPIVSLLQAGNVKLQGDITIDEEFGDKFSKGNPWRNSVGNYKWNGGDEGQ